MKNRIITFAIFMITFIKLNISTSFADQDHEQECLKYAIKIAERLDRCLTVEGYDRCCDGLKETVAALGCGGTCNEILRVYGCYEAPYGNNNEVINYTDEQIKGHQRFDTYEEIWKDLQQKKEKPDDDNDNHLYCYNQIVNAEKCTRWRDLGLKTGCITKKHITLLALHSNLNVYPACDPDEVLEGWCFCGCMVPETKILTQNEEQALLWTPISQASLMNKNPSLSVVTAAPHQDPLSMKLSLSSENFFIKGQKQEKIIIVIELETGKHLKVTDDHPVLLANGQIIPANQLKISDALVSQKGDPIEILSLQSESYRGDVYNVLLLNDKYDSKDLSHFIFAEGVAIGDMYWQNKIRREAVRLQARK